MKRNWELIREILLFLKESPEKKVKHIGCQYSGSNYGKFDGKIIIIEDEYFKKAREITIEEREFHYLMQKSQAKNWGSWEQIDFHVDLLVESKAIKLIIENEETIISQHEWDNGYYAYIEYDELIYKANDPTTPVKAILYDVNFYQITGVGLSLLESLS